MILSEQTDATVIFGAIKIVFLSSLFAVFYVCNHSLFCFAKDPAVL